MNTLERRIAKLENATDDGEPLDFIIRFVSTDGTPVSVCRLVDGELIDVEEGDDGIA